MNTSDLAAENARLRAELKGSEECLAVFVESTEGITCDLNAFLDACAADPVPRERDFVVAAAVTERMLRIIRTLNLRIPACRSASAVCPGSLPTTP